MADRAERMEYLRRREAEAHRVALDEIADRRDEYVLVVGDFTAAELRWLQSPLDKDLRDAADEARKQLSSARGALTQAINTTRDQMDAELESDWSAVAKPSWTAPEPEAVEPAGSGADFPGP